MKATVVLLLGLSVQSGTIIDRHVYGEFASVPACYLALDVIQRRIIAGVEDDPVKGVSTALVCLKSDGD